MRMNRLGKGKMRTLFCVLGLMLIAAIPLWAEDAPSKPAMAEDAAGNLETGEKVYRKRCIFCHGDEGGGDGVASERLMPKPRDFTMGLYKYRTTPSGLLPTDDDLFRVISKGLPGTGMPAWEKTLSEQERHSVIKFIKTFSKKFERQKGPLQTMIVGPEIASSPDSIEKGKALFKEMECFKCHGVSGRGNGPSALELTDDKGDPIRPRNLTKNWLFRGGGEARDIYMRFNTGLNGTPMPSFADSLDNEKSWHLANYVRSLSPAEKPPLNVVIKTRRVAGEIPVDPDDPAWRSDEFNQFPMVGQVIRHERNFMPTLTDVRVSALYNEREIALRVLWDDPTASKAGEGLLGPTFEDALAIQFPAKTYEGLTKPYFLMGDDKHPVQLWTWKSGTFLESNARGIDKEDLQTSQGLKGSVKYDDGQYRLVMKRMLKTEDAESDLQFEVGKFIPIAFHAWDGDNGETLTKRAISHWYFLLMEPEIPKQVYIYPPLVFVGVLGLMFLLQRKLRRTKPSEKS